VGDDAARGQSGVLAVVNVPHEPPVAVQDALGAVGFVVAEFDPAHHRLQVARGVVLDLGDIHRLPCVVVHAN
jgi:hypothetical protein